MVHSVYSDKDVFLRELVSNAADACEKLRYEALSDAALLGEDGAPKITVSLDAEARRLMVEDNGIGMSEAEMAEALGTIARSGTKAFMERVAASQEAEGSPADRPVSASASTPPSWSPTGSRWRRAGLAATLRPCGPPTAWAPTRSSRWTRSRPPPAAHA